MIRLFGVCLVLVSLSGCVVTAASGTRTDYQDKMNIIERDYRDKRISEAEYIKLKERAIGQGGVSQKNSPMSPSQEQALEN